MLHLDELVDMCQIACSFHGKQEFIAYLVDQVFDSEAVTLTESLQDHDQGLWVEHLCQRQQYAKLVGIREAADFWKELVLDVGPARYRLIEPFHVCVEPDDFIIF